MMVAMSRFIEQIMIHTLQFNVIRCLFTILFIQEKDNNTVIRKLSVFDHVVRRLNTIAYCKASRINGERNEK